MDPQRWRRLRPLLDQALDLPRADRARFVASLPANEVSLRDDLMALLEQQQRTDAALDGGNAAQLVAPAIAKELAQDADDQARIGRRIGPFQLMQLLGHGGMGAVYLGQRVDGQFLQKVAIKLVRGALGSPGARERFAHERQVLAQLVHPNIAQLLDGGDTDDGLQYFTMEYIDGVPITEYCRRYVPTVEGRLRLLVKVAAALAFAHANLVIHRDIKPGNILVTPDRRVKLLDFGIAKLIGEHAGRTLTRHELGPMTPEYAAPEQFRGAAITVATDVYQFGVLMFRTLTGRLPYRADPTDPLAWARAVAEQEPLTLGRALSLETGVTSGDASPSGWPDDASVARVRRHLSGDIEAIVRKALQKAPAQRYASMDALVNDLEACLAGRPVAARRAGPLYYAGRFVARHRVSVAIASVMAVAIVATAIIALQQAATARREAARATAEATRAGSAVNFIAELFEVADPGISGGKPLSARGMLDHGAQRLDRERTPDAARGPIELVLGKGYLALGEMAPARARLEHAIAALRATPEAPPRDLAHALERGAWAALRSGEIARAEAWLAEADALIGTDARHDDVRAEIRVDRFAIARDRGDYGTAFQLANDVLALAERLADGAPDYRVARAHLRLGTVLGDLGRYAEARVSMQRGRDLVEQLYGRDDLRTIGADSALGWLLTSIGDHAAAEALLDRAGARYRAEFGPRSAAYATNLYNRGSLYRERGEFARSRDAFIEVADVYGETSGVSSVERGWALVNAGVAMLELKDYTQALDTFAASEAAWRGRVPDDSPVWFGLRRDIARAHLGRGDVARARADIDPVIARLRTASGTAPQDLAVALVVRAEAALALGDLVTARRDVDEAMSLTREASPPLRAAIADVAQRLAAAERAAETQKQKAG